MKILLACSGGVSTSLLELPIRKYMEENNIEGKVEAHGTRAAKEIIGEWDVCLIGPQVGFQIEIIRKIADLHRVPVAVIPGKIYALAMGKEIVQLAQSTILEYDRKHYG